ncbi:MAG TPA: DUF2934 domain-containing protein [Methylomirabilota bacterium]|nr:DUF2934 domain-containing protein [Methylomirabilota bacterium]
MDASTRQPTHEEVARRAYELWEQRGRPQGRDVELWLEAEGQLRSSLGRGEQQQRSSVATVLQKGSASLPAPVSRKAQPIAPATEATRRQVAGSSRRGKKATMQAGAARP